MIEENNSGSRKKQILLLEDHIDAQAWLTNAALMAFGNNIQVKLAETIAAAKSCLKNQRFDLFLVDLNLPDGSGHEALMYAKKLHPALICIVTTIYSTDSHLFPALRAGASGYILKDESKENIAQMLKNINNGIPAISVKIAQKILSHFHEPSSGEGLTRLTDREREALSYIVKGVSVRDCAVLMEISHHTVAGYIKEIYRKLGVSSRAEMTREAMRLGVFPV